MVFNYLSLPFYHAVLRRKVQIFDGIIERYNLWSKLILLVKHIDYQSLPDLNIFKLVITERVCSRRSRGAVLIGQINGRSRQAAFAAVTASLKLQSTPESQVALRSSVRVTVNVNCACALCAANRQIKNANAAIKPEARNVGDGKNSPSVFVKSDIN
jgi:hypothetical protein